MYQECNPNACVTVGEIKANISKSYPRYIRRCYGQVRFTADLQRLFSNKIHAFNRLKEKII